MGRPSEMAELAGWLIAEGLPMLIEKPVSTSGETLLPRGRGCRAAGILLSPSRWPTAAVRSWPKSQP